MGNPELPPSSYRTPAQGTPFKNRTPLPVAPKPPGQAALEMRIFAQFELAWSQMLAETRGLPHADELAAHILREMLTPTYFSRFMSQRLRDFPNANPEFVRGKLVVLATAKIREIFTKKR